MKKIILHIGSGKAGSTSIQQALLNGRLKNKARYTYPVIPNTPGNQVIKYAFEGGSVPQNIKSKYLGKDHQDAIKSSFKHQCEGADNVIVSSEFLFKSSAEDVVKFGDFFRQLGFDEIHIMMYLRDPAKFYLSSAQQALKKQFRMPLPQSFQYQMLTAIERWANIVPTSITLREFDVVKLVNGDVVNDFQQYLTTVGVEARLNLERPLNESLCAEVTQALQDCYYHLKNTSMDDHYRNQYITRIKSLIRSDVVGGTKPKLKDEIEKFIHARFSKELSEIHSRYGFFETILQKKCINDEHMTAEQYNNIALFKDVLDAFNEDLYEEIRSTALGLPPKAFPCLNTTLSASQPGIMTNNEISRVKSKIPTSARAINSIASKINAKKYLEIGVNKGITFREVNIQYKVAVDERIRFDYTGLQSRSVKLFEVSSDNYFMHHAGAEKFDIIYLDGLNTFEQKFRDICNSLLHCHERTVMLINNTVPSDVYSAHRDRRKSVHYRELANGQGGTDWYGDVFKIVFVIHDFFPSLSYCTIKNQTNPQTLVWQEPRRDFKPLINNLELISRLTYFDCIDHAHIFNYQSEEVGLNLPIA